MTGDGGAASHPSEAARPGGGGWKSRSKPAGPEGLAGSGLSGSETPPRGSSQTEAVADGTRSSGKQLAGGVAQEARAPRSNNKVCFSTSTESRGREEGGAAAQEAVKSCTVSAGMVSLPVLLQSVTGPVLHGGAAAQPIAYCNEERNEGSGGHARYKPTHGVGETISD